MGTVEHRTRDGVSIFLMCQPSGLCFLCLLLLPSVDWSPFVFLVYFVVRTCTGPCPFWQQHSFQWLLLGMTHIIRTNATFCSLNFCKNLHDRLVMIRDHEIHQIHENRRSGNERGFEKTTSFSLWTSKQRPMIS